MPNTIFDPILADVDADARRIIQEEFLRHLVDQRNRMAALIKKWIESDAKFPIPIYDRLLDRIRNLDSSARADVASIALLMADEVVCAVLATFGRGDENRRENDIVNYAIIAQIRHLGSDEVIESVDVNRGEPIIPIWDRYKRWLARYAASELRPHSRQRLDSDKETAE